MLKIIFILFNLFAVNSYAADVSYWGGSGGKRFSDAAGACQSIVATGNGWKFESVTLDSSGDNGTCYASIGSNPPEVYTFVHRSSFPDSCTPPQVSDVDGVCSVPPSQCKSGSQDWYSWSGSSSKTTVCSGGCSAYATGLHDSGSGGSAGQFTTTGSVCTGGDTATPDPGTCPSGTTNISASGPVNCTADKPPAPKCWAGSTNVSTDPLIAVCVADGGPPKTGPDDPNSHVPDPSKTPTTKTTTTTEPTSDGGVKSTSTTTTTTSNTDGSTSVSSKTTTTITSPSGESKTTVDGNKAEDPTKDFCKQNPTLTICKNSSVSGDCDTLTIDGDAIQGAILRQQMKEYCDNNAASQIKDLGVALLANADPMQSQFPTIDNASIVDLSNIGNLDDSGFLGSGSCFADKSFNISGVAVRIPISVVCDYLIPLRLAIMLLALMASYKMVAGTVLRDL